MSEWLGDLHLLRPWWLLALVPLALLLFGLARSRGRDNAWRAICDLHLLQHLLISRSAEQGRLLLALLGLAWLLAVLALAGPAWTRQPTAVYQALQTRVVILDLSRSMDTPDLRPSRLARARFKIADVLGHNEEAQTGLVVFAGDAFVVAPITHDAETLLNLLPVLSTDLMPVQGSRVDLALDKAVQLLQQSDSPEGEILLLSDGDAAGQALAAAGRLRAAGYVLSVIGVGTAQGAPVTAEDGSLLKDAQGSIVLPRLDNAALEELARAGGGRYAALSAGADDLDYILASSPQGLDADAVQATDLSAENWRDEGPWLVLALLPLAALAFRRGWLFAAAVYCLPPPPVAQAWAWSELWQRRDQQAEQALAARQPGRALALAATPWQRGVAAYRLGDYAQAALAFGALDHASGHYNRGNALAQLRRYQDALQAYDAALGRDPNLEDARINRAIVEKLLQQQSQQSAPEPQSSAEPNPRPTPKSGAGAKCPGPGAALRGLGRSERRRRLRRRRPRAKPTR